MEEGEAHLSYQKGCFVIKEKRKIYETILQHMPLFKYRNTNLLKNWTCYPLRLGRSWSKTKVCILMEKRTSFLLLCSNLTSNWRTWVSMEMLAVNIRVWFLQGINKDFLLYLCLMSKLAPERCKTILALCLQLMSQLQGTRCHSWWCSYWDFVAHSFLPWFPHVTQGYMATRDNAPFGPFVVYEL